MKSRKTQSGTYLDPLHGSNDKEKTRVRKKGFPQRSLLPGGHVQSNTSATEDIKYKSQCRRVTMTTKVHFYDNRCPEDAAWLVASMSKK